MRRPAGVTIVGVLLILGAVLVLASALRTGLHPFPANSPVAAMTRRMSRIPARAALLIGYAFGLIEAVAGVLVLRRREAGRTLYAVVGGVSLLFAIANTTVFTFTAVQAAIYAIFVWLLFRPSATTWFDMTAPD